MWKKDDSASSSAPKASAPRSSAAPSAGAMIAEGMTITGEFSGNQDLLIRGEVNGTIELPHNTVTVGQSGFVKARIHAASLIIQGRVEGDLRAVDRIEIGAHGDVTGNLATPRLSLEDGAQFKGSIDMDERQASANVQPISERNDNADKPAVK